MNEPGGYEWLRGEGADKVLFIDEWTDPTPRCLLEQHADQKMSEDDKKK